MDLEKPNFETKEEVKTNKKGRLFIKNLVFDINENMLKKLFR